jgi:hypothetical protein
MEIHRRLYQNKIDAGLEEDRIAARVAKVQQRRNKDIEILSRAGSTPCQISHILGVHPDVVKARVAAIERDQKEKSDFRIMTRGPSQGGCFAILQL